MGIVITVKFSSSQPIQSHNLRPHAQHENRKSSWYTYGSKKPKISWEELRKMEFRTGVGQWRNFFG